MSKVILTVPGMSCDGCVRHVTHALQDLQGVQTVNVNLPTKLVQVTYDDGQVNVEQMKATLQEEDYPVASVQTA
jgi:copper chaperone